MGEVLSLPQEKAVIGKNNDDANVGTGSGGGWKKGCIDRYRYRSAESGCRHGTENRIVYNLVDVVEGSCRVKQALIRDQTLSRSVPFANRADKG